MRLALWSAAILSIKIAIHRIVGTVVHAWAHFERLNDFVVLTIHKFHSICIASVRNDKTVGFRQVSHRERLAEAFDAFNPLSRPQIEYFNRLLLFRRKEQAVALHIESK